MILFLKKDTKNTSLLRLAILTAGFISVTYGVCQFFDFDIFNRQGHLDKVSGFHKNPYTYAGQLIIFFFFFLNERIKKSSSFLSLVFTILSVFCILNSSERAVIVGVAIGVVFYFLAEKINKKDLLLIISFLVTPVIVAVSINDKLLKKVKNLISFNYLNGANIRFELWDTALSLWKKNIWFGVGKFPSVSHQISERVQHLTHAHNVYLQMLVTNGIIGLLSFFYLVFSVLQKVINHRKINQYAFCFISIVLAYFIEGFFEHFWGDSEVRYLILYFSAFVISNSITVQKV